MTTKPATDLTSFIINTVQERTSEDALREMIEKKIAETVKDAVNDAFRWGDVNKKIKAAVEDALQISDRLTIPSYSQMIMNLLNRVVEDQLTDLLNTAVATQVSEILDLGKREIKLSEIVQAMMDDIDVQERHGSEATFICEESRTYGYHTFYMDPEENQQNYDCDLRFCVGKEGNIFSVFINKKEADKTFNIGYLPKYQKLVFAAYATKAKILIDETEPCVCIGDY